MLLHLVLGWAFLYYSILLLLFNRCCGCSADLAGSCHWRLKPRLPFGLFFWYRRAPNDPEKYRPLSMDGGHSDAVLGLLSLPGENTDNGGIRPLERFKSNHR